eukprot:scaffold42867_cov63-Phaeocystis_antarctica.AAC.1
MANQVVRHAAGTGQCLVAACDWGLLNLAQPAATQRRARAEAVDPDPEDVDIDGLNPAPPAPAEEHEKPLSTASAWMHALFFEAAGWRMQVLP